MVSLLSPQTFFRLVLEEGYLRQNPIESIILKPPKASPIEPYKQEHIDAFVRILEHNWNTALTQRQKMLAARDRAVLFLLLDSLVRLEECTHLLASDIDLERQRIIVRKTKNGKTRLAGFGPLAKKALWRYLGLRNNLVELDALWITEEGHPLTRHGIQDIMKRLK